MPNKKNCTTNLKHTVLNLYIRVKQMKKIEKPSACKYYESACGSETLNKKWEN